MAFEVDDVEHAGASLPGVSGSVVQALVSLVRSEAGDTGLAQALALAAEERSFAVLGDAHRWTGLDDAVALFAAAALVTGDAAIALHVGQELLWTGDGAELAGRLRALDTSEDAFHHVGALVDHFEGATDAVAVEVAEGRALVLVTPTGGGLRNAHLCELTRGLLGELPNVFDSRSTSVTEYECAARGGTACRYEVRWQDAGTAARSTVPAGHTTVGTEFDAWPDYAVEQPARGSAAPIRQDERAGAANGNGVHGDVRYASDRYASDRDPAHGSTEPASPADLAGEVDVLAEQLAAARAALVEATAEAAHWEAKAASEQAGREEEGLRGRAESAAEAALARQEVERLEQLLAGITGTALDFVDLDLDALLAELASRADQVVSADRFLLMVRVAPGLPIELHHRGLADEEARALASRLWNAGTDADAGRQVVDIASPRRRYGRLAVFVDPGGDRSATDDRILRLFAHYAANVLDVFTVLAEARRSDSTARTILSFSERLSGLTNLAQALQILADTVPEVTGCGQSTVYLWDKEHSRLVLGAYTAGMTPPDADLGPIAPQWATRPAANHIQAVQPGQPVPEATDGTDGRGPLSVEVDNPLIQRLISGREVMVLDASTVGDPLLRTLMEESGIPASVVAPLFAAGEFVGVIAANFPKDVASTTIHDPDLHERLCGLADQAATAIQNLELLERVSHMAWHDALTGLPNRRLFEDRVEQELVRSRRVGEPVCMFFVDLDNFKTVNDTYGHATGDVLIQQVARRLVDTVRSQDTVARVGGDEFAILLPGLVDQHSINQLAERTLDAMHTPFVIFAEEVTTSASVGIAIAPEHGDTYDDLLNRADEAMYRAKDHGRDAFEMFHTSPDPVHPGRRAVDDRQLHADLVTALDGNQFFLLYQPYIDLRTAEVVGVEALIRWQHPTLGVLDPPQFIPMAERSDLIVSLDNWVLWQACRQLRTWRDHGMDPLRLSVNLASRDLSNPDFSDSVERTLTDTGVDPSLLELEITERVVLDKQGPAVGNIDRLRKLGVRFTIDNFGSGNSSLDRIGSFPVSTLKIDKSFVQVLGPEDEENSLVSAIIAMAGKLGLSCVAEGVETLLQSRVLLQRGCTTAQGYYFSPPLPPDGIEAMLESLAPAEVPESFGEPPADQPPGSEGAG
jgi:diguanylate cyclase (GGDEF)-like protein